MDKLTEQWTKTDADRAAVAEGCYFDLAAAERVRTFCKKFLRHSKGQWKGKPFELTDWEWNDLVAPFFGWKRADGTRRYRRFSVWIAKKNGKSTLCAALILYCLLGDKEGGAEVYSAAADKIQASIIYREAAAMVRQSPALDKVLEPVDSVGKITVKDEPGSFYKVLSKEAKKTSHGLNASGTIIDELHVVDRETHDTLRYAGAARTQPIFGTISTAGNDKDSLGYEQYCYAKRVRDGEIDDPNLLVLIYEADSNDSWEDEEQWKKANPSLGVTITRESFEEDFKTAKNGTASDQASFKQLRLNLWQDSVSAWIDVSKWDACKIEPIPYDDLVGLSCWGALDFAAKLDLNALVWAFRLPKNFRGLPLPRGGYYLLSRFWAPEEADSSRQRLNRQRLMPWMLSGHIRKTTGNVTDYDQIERDVVADIERFNPTRIAHDPWNATQVISHLMDTGLVELVEFPQVIRAFNDPMKELEKMIFTKDVVHPGNPVMRFCIKNVAVVRDSNDNQKPHKGKSTDKIDGVTAAIMALALGLQDQGSIYDNQGIDFFGG